MIYYIIILMYADDDDRDDVYPIYGVSRVFAL